MVNVMRDVMTRVDDGERNIGTVEGAIEKKLGSDVFSRVIYSRVTTRLAILLGRADFPA